MWTTFKYILMTAVIFFVVFVIFAFVLNIIKPLYHYFGRDLPQYMNISDTIIPDLSWTIKDPFAIQDNTDVSKIPQTLFSWVRQNISGNIDSISGDVSSSAFTGANTRFPQDNDVKFRASYYQLINTWLGDVHTTRQFDNYDQYIQFVQNQDSDTWSASFVNFDDGDVFSIIMPTISHVSTSTWVFSDPLLDISIWETKSATIIDHQYQQQLYYRTISRLQALKKFFVEYGATGEVASIDQRIQQIEQKISSF